MEANEAEGCRTFRLHTLRVRSALCTGELCYGREPEWLERPGGLVQYQTGMHTTRKASISGARSPARRPSRA